MQLCRKCGTRLTVVEEGQEYHPYCTPEHQKLPGAPMSLFEMTVREDLLEVVQWTDQSRGRSQQVTLGCSEAGNECERRIAMTMAGFQKVNFPDPLKANMGTAFHTWLDQGMNEYQDVHGISEWVTETEVWPAKFLKGHVDLYSRKRFLVLDWKTTSKAILDEWRRNGIPNHYLVQIMLYGKGMINAGYRVDRVGLIGIDRSGALRDVLVATVPYDEEVARAALLKIWNIGKQLNSLNVTAEPQNIRNITATPSRMCSYCPFYRGGTRPADATGCPGQNESVDSMFN
jgi:hypothetical protein